MNSEYYTLDAAYRSVLHNLEKLGIAVLQVRTLNNSRYILADTTDGKILIVYKREPFYNFGKVLREFGCSGLGDSLNCDDLVEANRNKQLERIYTIFKDGNIYSISFKEFMDKSVDWINKEGKRVRSISIHDYHKEIFSVRNERQVRL